LNRTANHADRAALSGPLAGASFISSLVALNALSEVRYPMPGADPRAVTSYFSQEHRAARLGAAAQLACAGFVGVFTRSVARLAGRATPHPARLRAAALTGSSLAAASLTTSALTTVALTTKWARDDAGATSLYRLMFVTGGPVHGFGLGLLVGALGLSGLRTGGLPDRLSKAALISSVAGALSPVALVGKPGIVFIPLGRLSALGVIGIAGARLARGKGR